MLKNPVPQLFNMIRCFHHRYLRLLLFYKRKKPVSELTGKQSQSHEKKEKLRYYSGMAVGGGVEPPRGS